MKIDFSTYVKNACLDSRANQIIEINKKLIEDDNIERQEIILVFHNLSSALIKLHSIYMSNNEFTLDQKQSALERLILTHQSLILLHNEIKTTNNEILLSYIEDVTLILSGIYPLFLIQQIMEVN